MDKVKTLKGVTKFVTNFGIASIMSQAIYTVMPANMRLVTRVCVFAADWVLYSMVSDAAMKHIDDGIDNVVVRWNRSQMKLVES